MRELPLELRDLIPMVLLSVILYVCHVPGLGYMRIDAVALTVILFSLYRPAGISLLVVFFIGLIQDVISISPLGQHALGLCVVAYLVQYFRDRIRINSLLKQLPSIALALLLLKLIYGWVAALGFGQLPSMVAILSVVLTMSLWPLIFGVGHAISMHRRLPGISH